MAELNRAFKGIWIPKEVWLNKDLTVMEKLFIVEIDSLDNENGCYASNKYFADFFDISKGRCSQIINKLSDKKLITIDYTYEGKEVKRRTIKVVNKLNGVVNKLNDPIKNIKPPYLENAKESNTSFSNTSNSNTRDKENIPGDPVTHPYKEIIEYLNEKTDKKYRHSTQKTKTLIQARYKEGFELEDFKSAIDIKVKEWKGTDMDKYLRPETLFGSKFESYLNQKEISNNSYQQQGKNNYDGWGLNKDLLREREEQRQKDVMDGKLPF